MTTAPAPNLHSIPPPLELRDDDLLVGWIDGDVVRFRGFDSERAAAQAAAVAHQAMLRRLARGRRGTSAATESDLAAVRRATDHAAPRPTGRPVASVLRDIVDGVRGAGDVAFEVRVPPPIDELRMRGMAYVMYRALRSTGVAWPLVQRASPHEALAAARTAATGATESAEGRVQERLHRIRRFLDRATWEWARPWTRPRHAA